MRRRYKSEETEGARCHSRRRKSHAAQRRPLLDIRRWSILEKLE